MNMKKNYMIGNTHFDPVWLWRWDEAMASIRATFRSALDRMKEDRDFIYSFATPPVFEWIRKVDREMFEEIQTRVREGRWELAEAWWVQADCYGASGESYVRQGLYGQRYLKKHFDRYSDCVFNIDSFGHSPMLPQILQKSGVRYYCFVRPEKHHVTLEHPLFAWKSADGSQVLAYRAEDSYLYDVKEQLAKETAEDRLIVYGVTDHGGAPTKQAIADIHADKTAHFSSVSGFFADRTTDYTVSQELLTGDFGPYANYAKIKKLNRIAEYALGNAERAARIAGREEQNALTEAWQDVLFNQFHDILGGACIKDAYIDAENQLGRAIATANEILHISLQSITRNIRMLGSNPDTVWNLVVWNLNGSPYRGPMEAEVQWAHEFPWYDQDIELEDGDGRRYPCQIIREKSVIPRFRSRFAFHAEIPSVGYRVFKVIPNGNTPTKKKIDPYCIETDRLTVHFSQTDGAMASVFDRSSGKQLLGRAMLPVTYEDRGDTWCFNVDGYEKAAHGFAFEGFQIIEAGDELTEIKGKWRFRDSLLEMYYRFYAEADFFDLRYRVHWEESHTVLKLETALAENEHTAAVPYGTVLRGEGSADLPLGAFLKCRDLTLAADGIFAYRVKEQSLGLTLLRSPIYGDLRLGELDDSIDYDIIDRGIVEGRLRLGFAEDGRKMAEALNNPPVVITECNHSGTLPATQSFYRISGDGIQIGAIKRCEEEDADILRLIECNGKEVSAQLHAKGTDVRLQMHPYEIKTLKIHNGTCQEVNLLELSENP